MSSIFSKVLSYVTDIPTKNLVTLPQEGVEKSYGTSRDLYDHCVLQIEEDFVNRVLRKRFKNHWAIYATTVEFEPNNQIFLNIITTWGSIINMELFVEDLWFDDYTSSITVKVDMHNVDMGNFVLNTIVHALGNWSLNLFGVFFNPIAVDAQGGTVRFGKNGSLEFNLTADSILRSYISWPKRSGQSQGPVLLSNPRTEQGVFACDYYAFHEATDRFVAPDIPITTSWVRSIDIIAALTLPFGVWITFIILHHYLPTQTIHFSFSTYFLISLGILFISFIVMNIPRYLYMYFDSRKHWQSVFMHSSVKIQMRKLHRRIAMQQAVIQEDNGNVSREGQERIRDLLLQVRDKRFLAERLKIADDDRDRKQKVKFILAYIICTLLEWMLLMQ